MKIEGYLFRSRAQIGYFFFLSLLCILARGQGPSPIPPSSLETYPDAPPPSGSSRVANNINFQRGSLIIDMGDRQIEQWTTLLVYNRSLATNETSTTGYNSLYAPHTTQKRVGSVANLFNHYAYGKELANDK